MITSIKLEEKQIQIGDRTYTLRVNMSVMDRIQEACGGEIGEVLKKTLSDANAVIMTAMLNDWAEDQHWEQDWTEKKVKKLFNSNMMRMLDITGMFFRAIRPDNPENEEGKPEEKSGN